MARQDKRFACNGIGRKSAIQVLEFFDRLILGDFIRGGSSCRDDSGEYEIRRVG